MKNNYFEVRRSKYRGSPTLDILKNGDSFFEDLPGAKEHFRFGVTKAIQILACLDVIKKFVDSGGVEAAPQTITNKKWKVNLEVTQHQGFKKNKIWVDRPYLEIRGEKTISLPRKLSLKNLWPG